MQHPQMLHEKFDRFQIWANNTKHVATCRNRVAKRVQHAATNNVAICCVNSLLSFGQGRGYRVKSALSSECKLGISVLRKDR